MTDELLAALVARANARGISLASEDTLRRDLQLEPGPLRRALAELEVRGAIEVLSPLPFLVARLRGSWPGAKVKTSKTPATTAASEARGYSYSFQSSLSQSKLLNESYRHPAEDHRLLREILDTLGETDPATFRGALSRYRPEVIRTTLERVRRMPTIRKNRTALFRYLLPRIAKERRH